MKFFLVSLICEVSKCINATACLAGLYLCCYAWILHGCLLNQIRFALLQTIKIVFTHSVPGQYCSYVNRYNLTEYMTSIFKCSDGECFVHLISYHTNWLNYFDLQGRNSYRALHIQLNRVFSTVTQI
jgi:hypothetical protein